MRILANENFPLDAVEALQQQGHDVAWVRADAPGSSDQAVLQRAQAEDRIVVTLTRISANWRFAPDFRRRVASSCFAFLQRRLSMWRVPQSRL